jgi:RNA polymerase sigma-70 factor (ECF subfamily)
MTGDGPTRAPGVPLDERIGALVACGDTRQASEEAMCHLGPAILRFARSCIRNEALACDAFSEFSEDLLRGIGDFRGSASVKTWAFRLAWHAVLRVRNDAWLCRRRTLVSDAAEALAREVRTATPVVNERRAMFLERIRGELSLEEQSLLALRVDQGLSWEEIAAVMAEEGAPASPQALAKRFQRLKDKLAAIVRREG